MGESWDEFARSWDKGAPVIYADAAAKSLRAKLANYTTSLHGARVLDFGCGTGLLAERLSLDTSHIVALDPSQGMIARLEEKIAAGLEGVVAIHGILDDTLLGTTHFTEPFDVVVASSVCAFLDDYPQTLQRLAKLITTGGFFVQWDWEYNPTDEEPFGLTEQTIADALQNAGLELTFVGTGFEAAFEGMTMAPLMGVGRKR